MSLKRTVALLLLGAGALAWRAASREPVSPGGSLPTDDDGLDPEVAMDDTPQPPNGGKPSTPGTAGVPLGTVAVAGVGVFGLSTWAGLVLDELSKGYAVVRLATLGVIAAGWIVPAGYCVLALRDPDRLSRLSSRFDLRAVLPPLVITGVLAMLHAVALTPGMKELVPILAWSCVLTLGTWSAFYHFYRQPPWQLAYVHVFLDVSAVFVLIESVWSRIAGSWEALLESSSTSDRFALAAVVLSGFAATVLTTSTFGTKRSVLCRAGNWCAGLLQFVVVLSIVQEVWTAFNLLGYLALGFATVVAWVVGLRDLKGARRFVVERGPDGRRDATAAPGMA